MFGEIGAENGYSWEITGDCIEFKTPLVAGEYKIRATVLTLEIATKPRQFYCLPMRDKWEIMEAANEIYRRELKNEVETIEQLEERYQKLTERERQFLIETQHPDFATVLGSGYRWHTAYCAGWSRITDAKERRAARKALEHLNIMEWASQE